MPREVFNIATFSKGIITAVDQGDIPTDSAAWSIDVDGDAPEGILRGRVEEQSNNMLTGAISAKLMTVDQSKYDLVYQTGTRLNVYKDFPNVLTATQLRMLPTSQPLCMTSRHRELRAGIPGEDPLWIGYSDVAQFGGAMADDILSTSARLSPGISMPFLYKVVCGTVDAVNYIVGAEFRGTRLYKLVTTADGALTMSEPGMFQSIQGLALANEAGYIWVYDAGTGVHGTLYYVSIDTLGIIYTLTLGSAVRPSIDGVDVSDLCVTTNKFFLAASFETGIIAEPVSQWVSMASIPSPLANGPVTFSNVTPYMGATDGSEEVNTTPPVAGEWYYDWTTTGSRTHHARFKMDHVPRVCLVNLGNDKVGWTAIPKFRAGYGFPRYCTGTGTYVEVKAAIMVLTESPTVHAKVPIFSSTSIGYMNSATYDTAGSKLFWGGIQGLWADTTSVPVPTLTSAPTVFSPEAAYSTGYRQVTPIWSSVLSKVLWTSISLAPQVGHLQEDWSSPVIVRDDDAYGLGSITASGTVTFSAGTQCYYKFALEYDGYQLSPLCETTYNGGFPTDHTTEGRKFDIRIRNSARLSPRVSGIAIFRATTTTSGGQPTEFYKLIEVIPLKSSRWVKDGTDTTMMKITDYTDNNSIAGSAYEALTGIPETETDNMIPYELSCVCNDELFVTKCRHPELPDAQQFIFKSQTGRHDMFNLTQNYLRLPFVPTAIAAYGGRVFVFSQYSLVIINPDGMYIEETFDGMGCASQRSLLVLSTGLYFAGMHGVFLWNGKQFQKISVPISQGSAQITGASFYSFTYPGTYYPIMIPFAKINSILIITYNTSYANIWVYNYMRNRWDYWRISTMGAYSSWGGFMDQYGRAWISAETTSYYIPLDGDRKAWQWYSQIIHCEDPSQYKKFYAITATGCGVATTYTDIWLRTDVDDSFVETIMSIQGSVAVNLDPILKVKMLQFILDAEGEAAFSDISIIYRRLEGKRV